MTVEEVLSLIQIQMQRCKDKIPTLGTLFEGVSEYARVIEGKHSDLPELELIQIASIAGTLLSKYSYDIAFDVLFTRYEKEDSIPSAKQILANYI